jgi:hypothetical protein
MMNKSLYSNLAMLGGVVMIAAGLVLALVTGMDILYGSLGLVIAVAGAGLTFWGRGSGSDVSVLTRGPERSTQKPAAPSQRTKIDRKI